MHSHAGAWERDKGQAEDAEIWTVRLDSGETKLVAAGFNPSFTETSHLLYCLPGQLMTVPFDPHRLEATGNPVLVVDGIVTKGGGAANYAVSEDGTLIYALGQQVAVRRNVVRVSEEGVEEILPLDPDSFANPSVSPDRRKLLVLPFPRENEVKVPSETTGKCGTTGGSGPTLRLLHSGRSNLPVDTRVPSPPRAAST